MSSVLEQIGAALTHIDAHDRDTWVQMGMAVKSELGEGGFTLWDSWSQGADNYSNKAAKAVWKSIKPAGRVTIASLFHLAIQGGWRPTEPYQAPTEEERAKLEAERMAAQAEAEAITQAQRQAARDKAAKLWDKGHEIDSQHAYLVTKGIIPIGASQLRDMLLIPLKDGDSLINLQIINPDGRKTFLTGGQVKGASVVLGRIEGADTVLLCEGWATGCSLHQATRLPVIVTFSAHNLISIAERVAAAFPTEVQVIVCGDRDDSQAGQKAANKSAALLYPRGRVVIPEFTPEMVKTHQQQHNKPPSDFNDLHQLAGLETVNKQLTQAVPENHTAVAAVPRPQDEDDYIHYLAGLKPLDYGRKRKAAAEALGGVPLNMLDKLVEAARKALASQEESQGAGGQVYLDEVEPWPAEVDAAAVLDAAYNLLSRYVITDRETLRAAALWAAMTWFADFATVLPLAVITAPEKGCGKSTLLTALAKLCRRPLYASNITPAALFRAVEKWKPSLMIDEADTFAKDNEELRGILNSGHTRELAIIVRTVEIGGNHEPRIFSTWGPKALAGIGNLPDTIMSRAIILTMRRKLVGENAENMRHADNEAFHVIKRQLARWADDMGELFSDARPQSDLHNRTADNWEPLLALADLAGGDWPKLARQAATRLTGNEEEATSLNEELLKDIRSAFDRRHTTKLWTADLLNELYEDEEAPWLTYNRGKPFTARQLSRRLGEFGVKPKDIRDRHEVKKGYDLEQFKDVFSRYLDAPPILSATTLQPNNYGHYSVADSHLSPTQKTVFATPKPLQDKDCSVVADRNPLEAKNLKEDDNVEYF